MAFESPVFRDRQLGSGLSVRAILKKDKLLGLFNDLEKKKGGREVLAFMADEYLSYVHTRHIENSNGTGSWAQLSARTIRERKDESRAKKKGGRPYKKRRHTGPVAGIDTILIDQGQLLGATAPNGRGQVRKLNVPRMEIKAGISGTTVYYDPRLKPPKIKRSLGQLAKWAAEGQPGGNRRKILVAPNGPTKTKMRQRIRKWLNELRRS